MRDHSQSERLFQRASKVIPGGVHSPVRAFRSVGGTPIFVDHADGPWLYDVDGNRYLDFCMSWGPLIFGHNDPTIAAAVTAAVNRGCTFGAAEAASLELAELITQHIPWVEQVRFVNSGTEAVMSAIRLARGATGRNRVVKFAGCYHGHADSLLVAAGSGLAGQAVADSAGIPETIADQTLVAPLDDMTAVAQIFEQHGDDIAAVIIEPLPANNGLLEQRPGFLRDLAELTRQNGALLIFDEVISGFRLAFGGAAEYYGIEPDLVTYGKIIGGGLPVGAYGGRAEILQQVAPLGPVYQAGTLSGNPLAMAAGLTTLQKLLDTQPYAALEQQADKLRRAINKYTGSPDTHPVHFAAVGSLFWLMFEQPQTPDGAVRSPEQIPAGQESGYPRVFHELLDAGIYLPPSSYEVGFLSTAHTAEQLDAFAAALATAIRA